MAYVAVSRPEAYLLATYAPPAGWKRPRPSPYFDLIANHADAVRDERTLPVAARQGARRLPPSPKRATRTITVTYSQWFVYWTCPRAFYIRFLLGFPPPLVPEMGYGESLHRAVREVHQRVHTGEGLTEEDLEGIALRHFHLPFADAALTADLSAAAVRALTAYHKNYRVEDDGEVAFIEQEIRLDLGAITLIGRIDLTTALTNGDIVLVEIKTEAAASTDDELYSYGLGLEASKGTLPDWVETRPIRADAGASDSKEGRGRKAMDETKAEQTRVRIRATGAAMAGGDFPMIELSRDNVVKCRRCDVRLICLHGQRATRSTVRAARCP